MNRKLWLIILLQFVICQDDDSITLFKIVKAISEVHYFSFYLILDSDENLADNHLYEELTKAENSGFSMVGQLPIEKYEKYAENVDYTRRTGCLKIVNGKHKHDRDLFQILTSKIDLGDGDVWLFALDDSVGIKDYLESLELPYDVQLIVAYMNDSKKAEFLAPYRVAKDFPLRIPIIGKWSEYQGLDLPTIRVALTRRDMEGFKFRAGTLNYPPGSLVIYDDSGGFTISGYFVEIWNELASRLNFTFEYYLSKDGATGSLLRDGTWTGLIGMLVKDEIDVAVTEFTITKSRSHVIDFCIPMMTTPLQIFFAQSGDQLEWGSLLRPFRLETWLVIFAWFIAAAIALYIFHLIGCQFDFENFVYKQEYNLFGSFFILFKAFTGQGSNVIPESSPSRIVFLSGYLIMGLILPSYSAALISYITVHTPIRPFTSLETMIQAGTHKLLAAKGTSKYSYFSDSKNPKLKEAFEKLMKPVKESNLPTNTREGMEMICNKNKLAYFGLYLSGKGFIEKLALEKGCSIMILENPVSYADATIAFRKGSPYVLVMNSEVKRMLFDGVLRRIEKQNWPTIKNIQGWNFEAIEVRHVVQIHILLLSGYLCAIFFLLLETLTIRRRRHKGYKKRLRKAQAFSIHQHLT